MVYLWGYECGGSRVVLGDAGRSAVHRGAASDIFKCHEHGFIWDVYRYLYACSKGRQEAAADYFYFHGIKRRSLVAACI